MLSIGELSRATGLTVKAIRLYHEAGLLVPSRVDPSTGYRYYDRAAVERARAIVVLRSLDFSVADCAEILGACEDEADLLAIFERQRDAIAEKLARYPLRLVLVRAHVHGGGAVRVPVHDPRVTVEVLHAAVRHRVV